MEKPDIPFKDIHSIDHDEIDGQIKIREFMLTEMVGTLYTGVLNGEIAKLKVMKMHPVKTKVSKGIVYFKTRDKWEMAGRKGHPLTQKFLTQSINKFYSELMKTPFFT